MESTFNWYWLVDGLRALGYNVVLANPAGIAQYEGLKHADESDAFGSPPKKWTLRAQGICRLV
jgi:hypothetical protein